MGESTNLRSLSTFDLGTLLQARMWTNHDAGWHLLLGIDVQSSAKWALGSQGVGPWASRDS